MIMNKVNLFILVSVGIMYYLKIRYFLVMALVVTSLSLNSPIAHAEDVDDVDATISDPLEGFNRLIYNFNHAIDVVLIRPVAKAYRFIVPDLARRGVRNVLTNLSEPLTLINSALQGDRENSFTTFWRFTINSTFGIAGIFDVAKDAGLVRRSEDFGQTAGVYGSGTGAYLMLPILGPSNARDALGKVVDVFTDPFYYILTDEALLTRTAVGGLDAREGALDLVDHVESTSLDPYATIRSLYTQKRLDDIRNGKSVK